jgi:hypothetical protein
VISSLPLQSADANQRIELEYGWEMLVDRTARMQREEAEQSKEWRSARVGLSWNAQFEDLRDYMGAAWYRVRFELPAFRDTRHVLLKFGAVDYFCEVFLNGLLIGTHEGGYTPFSFEITSAVHPGPNEMVIRVVDPPMDEVQNRALFPDMMYNEIPHGKQNWYVQNSGIWQGVRVELCPSIYIERLDVTPQADGHFEVIARLAGVGLTSNNGGLAAATVLETEVLDNSGRRVFSASQNLDASSPIVHITGTIANPRLWSPENPALYSVKVSLSGPVEYRRNTRFGFRSFEARDGKLYLNGKPFYMMAALDQDFYPETVHTPTSVEFVRDMMMKAKYLGINLLRCHLKVAHPVYLDVADEVGMLIWTELPSWSDCWFPADHFSSMAAVRADRMFWEILIRDWNHPCIVLQTIINESWGINLKEAFQREWLRTTFDRVKGLLAPLGRLVVDNSACEGNFHLKTDIEDFHQYYSMPDQVDKWNKWLDELSNRPDWTFSPYGDAERTRREPLLVSEFGNWGLPKLPQELPWWFDVSFGDREVTRPEGVLERFKRFGFDEMFGTFNEMAEETQWHQFISLKYEIESIRSREALQGYVITGITDVHWEVNGLLDMWRNEKVYAHELSALQQPDLIMCQLPAYSFQSGETIEVNTLISHFSSFDLSGARVRWSTDSGAGGNFILPADISRGTVARLQPIRFTLPQVSAAATERLEIEVRLRNGHRTTENSYDLFVLPAATPNLDSKIKVEARGLPDIAAKLRQSGYDLEQQITNADLIIVDNYSDSVATHLQNGGTALLIANSEDALPKEWPIRIKVRAGSELDGRWFSNYNWIRTTRPPFSSLGPNAILGFESARVAPEYIVQNIQADQFQDVLAGITIGWLNCNSALVAQLRVGAGKLLIATFRFDQYRSDPYATHLLDSLIAYVCGGDCQPIMQVPERLTASSEAT